MPERGQIDAYLSATKACRDMPLGNHHDECMFEAIMHAEIGSQVASDRADMLLMAAVVTTFVALAALVFTKLKGKKARSR